MMALRKLLQLRHTQNAPHHYDRIPEEANDRHNHSEDHFESPELIRDMILGISDGLTVIQRLFFSFEKF